MSTDDKPSVPEAELPEPAPPPFPEEEAPDAAHLAVGKRGEDVACRDLWKRGFRIVKRNYKGKRGEIDIIAEARGRIHLVEVKTRTSDAFGPAEERVDAKKRDLIRETARQYLNDFRDPPEGGFQFDVVSVYLDAKNRPARVDYLPNAF
jgi:putative endonuclease